jgi:membrane fusion protein, heavy metal efflux system
MGAFPHEWLGQNDGQRYFKTLIFYYKLMKTSLLTLSIMLGCLWGCQPKNEAKTSTARYCLSDTLAQTVRIDTARLKPVISELKLIGKITFNEDKVVNVFPLVSGRVLELKAQLGDYVQKGQMLALLQSGDIAGIDQDLVAAESNLRIAQKNLDVTEDMYKSGLTAERDVANARQEVQKAEGELNRVRQTLKVYGAGSNNATYTVRAPIAGFVVAKNITENMDVRADAQAQLFTISDLDKIWVLADVYETDIEKVALGMEAKVTTVSYPDQPLYGQVDKVFNVLDPQSRVMKIRVVLPNANYRLKPEMFANVALKFDEGQSQRLAVPSNAIVFDQNKNFVVVYKDKCQIEAREVQVYRVVNGTTYLSGGLSPGELVISRSQLLVYKALQQNE